MIESRRSVAALTYSISALIYGIVALGLAGPGVLSCSLARAEEVRVETSGGEVFAATWSGVGTSSIKLNEGATTRELSFDQLISIRFGDDDDSMSGPPKSVTLSNGSEIRFQDAKLDASQLRVRPRRQPEITIPLRQVRALRFRPESPATDPQWFGLFEKEARGDLMVIRRGNDQLDPIDGLVVGLDGEILSFELDGDKIEAPVERLEGVLFRSSTQSTASSAIKVTDIFGSTYVAAGLRPSDASDSVRMLLPGDIEHPIPIDQVRTITWASGRLLLASSPTAGSSAKPTLPTRLPQELLDQWFAPVSDGDDIVATAGSSSEYRIEPGFQTFAGSVGRDQEVAVAGSTVVKVVVDEEVRWEQTISDRQRKGFRIPIAGSRRLRLEIHDGGDGDVGDQVRFYQPRLLK